MLRVYVIETIEYCFIDPMKHSGPINAYACPLHAELYDRSHQRGKPLHHGKTFRSKDREIHRKRDFSVLFSWIENE